MRLSAVHRFAKLTRALIGEYVKTLKGRVPDQTPRYQKADEDDTKVPSRDMCY